MALMLALGFGNGASAEPEFTALPTIQANPNESVPLGAIVSFEASEPVETTLAISDGERTWNLAYPSDREPEAGLPVVGMKYGTTNQISIKIANDSGETAVAAKELEFATPPKPTDPMLIPPIRVVTSKPEQMEPGYTVLSLRRNRRSARRRNPGSGATFGLLAAIDHKGEIVWSYQSDARISDVEPTRNNTFLFVTTDNRVTEIDLLGNRVGHWYAADRPRGPADDAIGIPVLTMHHEVDELSNGNILVMGTELREYDNWYTSETDPDAPRSRQKVMGDVVIEFTRSGEVVWQWKALDHLDPYRIGYETFTRYWINRGFPGARDWSHGNGFFHDERDDSLLISFRMQDAVVKIDRKTGEIVWILGDHSGWPPHLQQKLLTPEGEMAWFYHQHMPYLSEIGTLILFDNRTWSARPFAPPLPPALTWTRAVEYEIDEQRRTVKEVWASEGPAIDRLMTFAMGEADLLPDTGNVLIFYGSAAVVTDMSATWDDVLTPGGGRQNRGTRIREYTRTDPPECVWDIDIYDTSEDQVRWGIYGGARISGFGN